MSLSTIMAPRVSPLVGKLVFWQVVAWVEVPVCFSPVVDWPFLHHYRLCLLKLGEEEEEGGVMTWIRGGSGGGGDCGESDVLTSPTKEGYGSRTRQRRMRKVGEVGEE